MAKTPKTVKDFLNDLRTRLADDGKKEIEHLLEIKKQDSQARGAEFDGNYYLWDHRYYDRLMIMQEYGIDGNKIAEYFPLSNTIAGMLKIFEHLFGLVFVELTPEDRARISPTGKAEDIAWHDDVIIFSVWNDASEGDDFVGYLYLDLHPRQGKYGHAANFNLQPGFLKADGSRRYPATALVCNFSKPTPNKPSLLKHEEVVTLFHELGHGIHDLTGRTRYSRFHVSPFTTLMVAKFILTCVFFLCREPQRLGTLLRPQASCLRNVSIRIAPPTPLPFSQWLSIKTPIS